MHDPLAQISLVALDSARAVGTAAASAPSDLLRAAAGAVAVASLGIVAWKILRGRSGEPAEAGEPAPADLPDVPIDGEPAKSLRFSAIRRRMSGETAPVPENATHAGAPDAAVAPKPRPASISAASAMQWETMSEEQREEFITALGQTIAARKEEVETEVLRRLSGPSHAYSADAHCPECGSPIEAARLQSGRIVCAGCGREIAIHVVADETDSMASFVLISREKTPPSSRAVTPL